MVNFTGGAGPINGVGTVFEWSDVIVVVQNNVIVNYFTQFTGGALPNSGADVNVGSFDVQLSSLTYRHLGNAVGVNNLTLDGTAKFTQAATNFTVSGKLTNNGLANIFADTTLTGQLENNNLMTVGTAPDGRFNYKYLKLTPVNGDFNLSGSGDIRLRDGFLTGQGGESSITNFINSSTITGYGIIGAYFGVLGFPGDAGYLKLTNTAAGKIEANVTGEILAIQPNGLTAVNPLVNAGLLAASNGGILNFNSVALVEQSGAGTIKAFNGSTVNLIDTVVRGGTLDGEGTGLIVAANFTTRLIDVDLTATARLSVNRGLTLEGLIENRGTIIADAFQNGTTIAAVGVTLTGGGTFRLAGNDGGSLISGEALGAVLTNVTHTIQGNGRIAGANLTLVNSDLISAIPDGVAPPQFNRLQLDALAGVRNTGILEANGAARLELIRVSIDNTGGTIRAVGDGSKVSLGADTRVQGGTFATTGNGEIRIEGFGAKLTDVQTLAGTSFVDASSQTVLEGAIVNRGTFIAGGQTYINVNDVTLTGGGTLRFTGRDGDSSIVGQAPGAVLTNGGHTILGAGVIAGANLTLFNAGLISATPESVVRNRLALDSLEQVRNTGILEANGAATLELARTSIGNAGGTIRAVGTGATVVLGVDLTITGGTLATTGTGLIRGDGQLFKLVGVETLAGTNINLASASAVLEGAIVNRGSIIGGFRTSIHANDVTLSGGGTFRMTGFDGDSSIVGQALGAVLTNAGHTILGAGVIAGANLTLVNSGVISATREGVIRDRMAIDSLAGVSNSGIFEANAGGQLELARISVNNAGGTIRAVGDGSKVTLGRDLDITGGTFATTGTGLISAEWFGGQVRLTDVQLLAGTNFDVRFGAIFEGAIANSGTINVTQFNLRVGSTQFTGDGKVALNNTTLVGHVAGVTLNNVAHTIGGAGSLGGGSGLLLVNGAAGVITADQVGGTLRVETGTVVTNNGVLSANRGILDVIDNVTGTGRLEVTNGGTLIVDQGTDQAVVFVGAAADTLSLSRREASAGGYDFNISGMGIGDRIKLDVGAAVGQEVAFTFTPGTTGATLSTAAFANGAGAPFLLHLTGTYAFSPFNLIGGADGSLGFVRVAATQEATEGNDVLNAAVAGDRLFGLGGNDTLNGNAGTDLLEGDAGNDILFGAGGNDTLNGGDGVDTAVFTGIQPFSRIGQRDGVVIVSGPDGMDQLTNIELLQFGGAAAVSLATLQAGGQFDELVLTNIDGVARYVLPDIYAGPVAGVKYQWLGSAAGEVALGTSQNDFFNLLGGDDAVDAGAGNDIIDGGIGSNFLTGGAGLDIFFLDGRGGTTTWSTITDWQTGEQLSFFGWRPGVSQALWVDSAGAAGYQGVTMFGDLDANGTFDTSVTWSGRTRADLPTPYEFDGLLWFV